MRYLFVQDDGRGQGDIYPAIEDYIRNIRKDHTSDNWATPINYRFPHRSSSHMWKIVRNLNNVDDPRLAILGKNDDQFRLDTVPSFEFAVTDLLDAADANYAKSIFVIVPPHAEVSLENLTIAVKDTDGAFIALNGTRLTRNQNNEFCVVVAACFRIGALPIYVMYMNNNVAINKVWFRNLQEKDSILVFGENVDPLTSVFSPVLSDDVVEIGKSQLFVTTDKMDVSFFGIKKWAGVAEDQVDGSEIVLSGYEPPILTTDDLMVESNFKYSYDRNVLSFNVTGNGYIKISIRGGIFFHDFGTPFHWEWIVTKG